MGANQSDLTIAALDRTLRLMRDELRADVTDADLVNALTGTKVALVAGEESLKSHAAQSAFIAAALLMGRTGHAVYLAAPNVRLVGPQPPLIGERLLDALLEVGSDLVPGIEFRAAVPKQEVDAVFLLDNVDWPGRARSVHYAGANEWRGWISPSDDGCSWPLNGWPIGGLGASDLIAAEAFKLSMRKLRRFARHFETFDLLFASASRALFALAPDATPGLPDLGMLDLVSGGAIVQASLFAFSRIPRVTGRARVIESDVSDISNLNRNCFLRFSRLGVAKADDLADQHLGSLCVTPVRARYEGPSDDSVDVGPIVLVGVDHIPTRWAVQRSQPRWVGVGATSHFMAMSSFHRPDLPCAGCLHPKDDPSTEPIPTVACVSFAAGLMMAAQYLRKLAKTELANEEQQVIFRPLRPERLWCSPVAPRPDCPVGCPASMKEVTTEIGQV
jgi:hypothetical protein